MTTRLLGWGATSRRLDAELLLEPRDTFVGVFRDVRTVEHPTGAVERFRHFWVVVIPCFPVHVWWFIGYDLAREAALAGLVDAETP